MEENLHNHDNLESFFQNHLEQQEETPTQGDWDMPDDSLWDKISASLPEESPEPAFYISPKIRFIAAAVLLLITGLSLFLYFQNQNLNRIIEQQNEIVQKGIEHKSIDFDKRNTALNSNEADYSPSPTDNPKPKASKTIISQTPNQELKNNTNDAQNKSHLFKTPEQPTAVNPPSSPEEKIQPIANRHITKNDAPISGNTSEAAGNVVVSIPSLFKGIENKQRQDISQHFISINAPKRHSTFFIGAFLSNNYSGRRVRPASNHPLPPFRDYEKFKTKINWSAKLGVHLTKKWDIVTGVSQIKTEQIQKRRFLFDHNSANEHPMNNEFVSEYSLSMSSSYGISDAGIEISRPNNAMLSDNQLPVEVIIKQKTTLYSIPVLFRYNTKVGSFNLALQAGLAVNFLDQFQAQFQVNSLRPNFHARPVRSISNPPLGNKSSLDFVAGIGLIYSVNQHLSLAIEPQFQKNIRPFIHNEQFESSFYVGSVQIGSYWNF